MTQTPIRKIILYVSNMIKEPLIAIMLYQNYYILYGVRFKKYVKITGHKSFVANISYDSKQEKIISVGMDHRIGIIQQKTIT